MPYAVARCHGVPTPPHGLGLPRLPRSPRQPAPVVTLNVALEPLTWRNGPTWPGEGATGGLPSGFHPHQTWENLYLYRKSARKSPWNGAQRVQRTDWFRRHRHYVARWWLVKGIIPKSMKNSNFFSLSNPLPPQSSIPTRKLGPFHFLEEKKRYINRWVIPESSLKSSSHIPAVFFQ